MTHRRAVAWMIVGALMWSVGGLLSRFFHTTDGFEVTFWRSVFAALTVLVWFALSNARSPIRQLLSGGPAVWASGLMWSVMFTCFMFSLSLTTVANVLITQSLAPVFTALLASVVLRRPVGPRAWLAIVVAAAGVCLMYVFDVSALEGRHALGVLVALGIPTAGAINWILLQRAGTKMDLTSGVFLGAVISAALTLPMAWPLGVDAHDLGLLAVLGVFQLGIPCILVMRAAAHLAAAQTSLLALLEVVFGIALTWLFGGETPGWATVAGGLAVLAALAYNELGQPRPVGPGGA
jgi:drug/metabolite transporter (DMT)-like permease